MGDSKSFAEQPSIRNFFGVVARGRTYRNLFYLALSFPLGTFYFTLLVTLISLGVGLSVVIIGFPILLGTLAISRVLGRFERSLAEMFLEVEIPAFDTVEGEDFMVKARKVVTDVATWKSLVFLFIRFPLGLLAFTAITVLGTLSLVMLFAPLLYAQPEVYYNFGFAVIDTLPEAVIVMVLGVFVAFGSLHIFNALARSYGLIAKTFLGKVEKR